MSIRASTYRGFDVDVIRTGEHRQLVVTNPETGEVIHDDELPTAYWYQAAKSFIDDYIGGSPEPESGPLAAESCIEPIGGTSTRCGDVSGPGISSSVPRVRPKRTRAGLAD